MQHRRLRQPTLQDRRRGNQPANRKGHGQQGLLQLLHFILVVRQDESLAGQNERNQDHAAAADGEHAHPRQNENLQQHAGDAGEEQNDRQPADGAEAMAPEEEEEGRRRR